jgi:hypothetical protein
MNTKKPRGTRKTPQPRPKVSKAEIDSFKRAERAEITLCRSQMYEYAVLTHLTVDSQLKLALWQRMLDKVS